MSLSVEVANPALALYERHGFVSIGIKTGAHTMRKNLTG
jgi:ribosomal protein S18 acetylase RimI-like enzyme